MSSIGDQKENSIARTEQTDATYGGCHYRLSYDKYSGNLAKTAEEKRIRPLTVAVCIVCFVGFFLLGYLISRYFSYNVNKVYGESARSNKLSVVGLNSYDDSRYETVNESDSMYD